MSAGLLGYYSVVVGGAYILGRTIVARQRRRNNDGACALCGNPLDATATVPAGGLMMCPRCARRTTRSHTLAFWLAHVAVGLAFLPAIEAFVYPWYFRTLPWTEIVKLALVPTAMLLLLVVTRGRLRRALLPNS